MAFAFRRIYVAASSGAADIVPSIASAGEAGNAGVSGDGWLRRTRWSAGLRRRGSKVPHPLALPFHDALDVLLPVSLRERFSKGASIPARSCVKTIDRCEECPGFRLGGKLRREAVRRLRLLDSPGVFEAVAAVREETARSSCGVSDRRNQLLLMSASLNLYAQLA